VSDLTTRMSGALALVPHWLSEHLPNVSVDAASWTDAPTIFRTKRIVRDASAIPTPVRPVALMRDCDHKHSASLSIQTTYKRLLTDFSICLRWTSGF
jgi:hypothetical protein